MTGEEEGGEAGGGEGDACQGEGDVRASGVEGEGEGECEGECWEDQGDHTFEEEGELLCECDDE